MFGSIFPICFSFPPHRMWEARITQHSLLVPQMPLNSLLWIFCSNPWWITWMAPSTHQAISYFWAFARAVFSAQIAPLIPISLEKLLIIPKGTAQDSSSNMLTSVLAVCTMNFIKEIFCVCLHHENLKAQKLRNPISGIFVVLDGWQRKIVQQMLFQIIKSW